ncbi:MAG: hypothetical protein ACRC33_16660 [Gemmataceae bacterium]
MIRILLALLAVPAAASAHAVGAEAKLNGGRVHLEAYYDDNTAAADAAVKVEGDGAVVAQGRTDDDGKWAFAAPPEGAYRVTVDAGAGHRVTINVVIPPGTVPATEPARRVVSAGRSREEFTRVPWGGLVAGVGLLGLVAAGSWAIRAKRVVSRP